MPEAYSEDWQASHEAANVVYRIGTWLRVTGAVREKHAIRLHREHIFCRSLRRDYSHLAAFTAQLAQNVLLNPVIVSNHVKSLWLVFYSDHCDRLMRTLPDLPHVGVLRRDDLGQIHPVHLRNGAGFGGQLL